MESMRYLPMLGRILIGLPFIITGLGKVTTFGPTTTYIASMDLPLAPLGWAMAVIFEVGGGICLLLGFRVRAVASGLAVFTFATAIFFHHNFADQNQMIHFLKNIVIIGGLLQIVHFGAGRSARLREGHATTPAT